ncbi:hypothetical protein HJFPF1_13452 [Paramyrothecium foliicola]|nr:hypothetical protein HJFPF1_13452 [Paramyrothecium foliicola]
MTYANYILTPPFAQMTLPVVQPHSMEQHIDGAGYLVGKLWPPPFHWAGSDCIKPSAFILARALTWASPS